MPDEYDDYRRQQRLTNYERGLYFELGRAQERGETRESGWVRQFEIRVGNKRRILDIARTDGRGVRGVERKSGRVPERETLEQLKRERSALESGILTNSRWETVAGEKVPPEVAKEMQAMARDFPGRFHHQVISRADALRAIQLGQSMMSKQLELIRAYELLRADRARERLENIREIVRTREAKTREERARVEREPAARVARELPTWKQILTREDNQDQTQPPAITREHTEPTPKAREAREREEAQAREMVNSLGSWLSEAQKEQVLAARRKERKNERKAVVLEMKPTHGQETLAPLPAPQRTPEQERENALARAIQERENARALAIANGLSREIMDILGLNSNEPPKLIDVDQARTRAEADRDHRSRRQRRERERAEREREGRSRGDG